MQRLVSQPDMFVVSDEMLRHFGELPRVFMELATQQFIRVTKLKMHRYYLIQEKVEKLLKSDSLSTILRSFFLSYSKNSQPHGNCRNSQNRDTQVPEHNLILHTHTHTADRHS